MQMCEYLIMHVGSLMMMMRGTLGGKTIEWEETEC